MLRELFSGGRDFEKEIVERAREWNEPSLNFLLAKRLETRNHLMRQEVLARIEGLTQVLEDSIQLVEVAA